MSKLRATEAAAVTAFVAAAGVDTPWHADAAAGDVADVMQGEVTDMAAAGAALGFVLGSVRSGSARNP
ncbi:MAG: hypothetical protein WCD20_12245 [Rhodomicrobium sp.]